jgi:hypothetical protein
MDYSMQNDNQPDKAVLITGGVGRVSAERFLEDKYRVVTADIKDCGKRYYLS